MAQLPPKFPPNYWPSFNHPRLPSIPSSFFLSSSSAAPPAASSWTDEFFDFTSSKRGSHRRAISDSIAFESAPGATNAVAAAAANFDRLDEDQLMSMFSDDPQPPSSAPPSTAPSSPSSDRNSISDRDKLTPPNSSGNDQSEAQSASNSAETPLAGVGAAAAVTTSAPKTPPPIVDPKRVKRILANRQSAQRSRVRKLQYISDLEKSVNTLQTEVSALSPRVAFFDHQRSVLSVDNSQIKQRIAALAQDKLFKDANLEALQNEIERLRRVFYQQSLKKMAAAAGAKSDGPVFDAGKKLDIPAGTDHDPSSEC